MAEEEMTMANCACDWDEEDEMSLTQFYLSRRRSSSSNFDNRQPHSMVVFNRAETSSSYKQSHASANNDEAKSCPRESADEVQANLNPMIPSFVKTMLPSHVTRGFWLGLPSKFCKAHLPKQDVTVTLVDENEENYFTNYLPRKLGLSGGWKEFAFAHSLVVGDTIVFQLVNPTTFKVHITRVFSQCASDGAIDLLTLDSHPKLTSIVCGKSINGCEKFVRKRRRKKTSVSHSLGPSTREKPGSDAEEVECIRFVDGSVAFKDVKDKRSFLIAVNGLVIDSELSKQDRTKYYQLCRSQGTFLHENLIEGINIKLAAGAISQTVEIADGIKGSKVNTSQDDFAAWDDSLQGLELLGMNVRFLRARVQKLVSIAYDSEEMVGQKQYSEAVASRDDVEEEVRSMKAKLANLRSSLKRLDTQIKTMQEKNTKQMLLFQAEVNAPW